jgi:2-C-methyl-D-erythritol 4-phosphate cytidylyltransferase / 2-C-methyl-D-erythritol 2,4-cyclodiphosphate synthase
MEGRFADAVIVAAGASRRMGGTDKLEALLGGRPLLAWSVQAMAQAASVARLVVVAAAERVDSLAGEDWLRRAAGERPLQVVAGGAQRSDSVRAGVEAASAEVILVHDGARPLVTPSLADAVAAAAATHGAAIPALPVTDSLRRVDRDGWIRGSLERDGVAAAQTPQAARRELLLSAFRAAPANDTYTDEAALLAAIGAPVATVEGDAANLKVTRPADLALARQLVAGQDAAVETRNGHGQDSHPFGALDGLWLGGLLIEQAPRLHGHSDGDVALHALATALLSAARLGDLGRRFPPSDPATAGAASVALLDAVLHDVSGAGWQVKSAQVSLLGARPRLGGERLEQMRRRIAHLLAVAHEEVAVVASSGNLAGPEGAGLVVSASAFVTLQRR